MWSLIVSLVGIAMSAVALTSSVILWRRSGPVVTIDDPGDGSAALTDDLKGYEWQLFATVRNRGRTAVQVSCTAQIRRLNQDVSTGFMDQPGFFVEMSPSGLTLQAEHSADFTAEVPSSAGLDRGRFQVNPGSLYRIAVETGGGATVVSPWRLLPDWDGWSDRARLLRIEDAAAGRAGPNEGS